MKMQTVLRSDRDNKRPQDFSAFKHGTVGEVVPYTNKVTGKSDPFFRYENGAIIFVESLEKAGAEIVPLEG